MPGILQSPWRYPAFRCSGSEVPLLRDTEVPLLRIRSSAAQGYRSSAAQGSEGEARRMRKGSGVERRALLCAAGGAAALSSLAALSRCDQHAEPRGRLRIATGPRGGVYYRLGEGLAEAAAQEYPGLRPAVLVTAASATNVTLVDAGQAEVGFTQADVLIGTGLVKPLALARLHEDYLHLVVRADGGLRSLSDLRGR